jgi:predicted nucleotidyltransferase
MDKNDAIRLSINYLNKLKSSNIRFSEAWLFGSYAKGSQHENSDIDIAIVLDDSISYTFETEIQLMIIRKGEETMIEPHAFSKEEFNNSIPIVKQILDYGIRIK